MGKKSNLEKSDIVKLDIRNKPMTTFQHKDRVIRHIKDRGIELVCGSPRVYVIKKDKNTSFYLI